MQASVENGPKLTIAVLGTGGTIAGLTRAAGPAAGYDAAQVAVGALLGVCPTPDGVAVVSEQIAQLDSKDMVFPVWRSLALRCAYWLSQAHVLGVVVTHGTDTLEETAMFLHAVLGPAKPLVLTCAMRPADALSADGPANLRDALSVAAWPGARGVVAVCAGTVHAASEVRKVHTSRLDAFGSGDAGPLGYVEQGRVRSLRAWPEAAAAQPIDAALLPADGADWPWVELVSSHAGADGSVVDALVRAGVRGLVVACTGNGSIHHCLQAALLKAQGRGVQILRSTRCAQGEILDGLQQPVFRASPLTPAKARVKLLLELLAARARRRP